MVAVLGLRTEKNRRRGMNAEEVKKRLLAGERVALVDLLREYGVEEDGEIKILLPDEEEEPSDQD